MPYRERQWQIAGVGGNRVQPDGVAHRREFQRLDEIQAAVLRVKLHYLDCDNELRRRIAGRYQEQLQNLPGIRLPGTAPAAGHVYHHSIEQQVGAVTASVPVLFEAFGLDFGTVDFVEDESQKFT